MQRQMVKAAARRAGLNGRRVTTMILRTALKLLLALILIVPGSGTVLAASVVAATGKHCQHATQQGHESHPTAPCCPCGSDHSGCGQACSACGMAFVVSTMMPDVGIGRPTVEQCDFDSPLRIRSELPPTRPPIV
jgi:hypothetical protein